MLDFARFLRDITPPLLIALLAGLVGAIATGLITSVEQATRLPGGAFATGLVIGIAWTEYTSRYKSNWVFFLTTAMAGLLGWAIYTFFI